MGRKERMSEYHKLWYQKNKEAEKVRTSIWAKNNKEKANSSKRKLAILNPFKIFESHLIWKRNNRDKIKEINRIRNRRPEVLMKHKEFNRIWGSNNKIKIYAQHKAKLIPMKSSCELCDSKDKLQRHHWRYDKPLLINTLCSDCHNVQHTKKFRNSIFGGGKYQ